MRRGGACFSWNPPNIFLQMARHITCRLELFSLCWWASFERLLFCPKLMNMVKSLKNDKWFHVLRTFSFSTFNRLSQSTKIHKQSNVSVLVSSNSTRIYACQSWIMKIAEEINYLCSIYDIWLHWNLNKNIKNSAIFFLKDFFFCQKLINMMKSLKNNKWLDILRILSFCTFNRLSSVN